LISELITSRHPSTRRKRRILNGMEMSTGGNIIIPIDMRMLEMTMSMMRNGMKRTNPI
jgi:hypothetical protein